MQGVRAVRAFESWRHIEWRTREACVRGRGLNAGHKRLTVEQQHMTDSLSVGFAFFGEHDQTPKLVLIVREHRCRLIEALRVQNREGQVCGWIVKSVADMVRRAGL